MTTIMLRRTDGSDGGRARAHRVISELRDRKTVLSADAGSWKVLAPGETRDVARGCIEGQLGEIDGGWAEVLRLA
jgi:hypothetical protein